MPYTITTMITMTETRKAREPTPIQTITAMEKGRMSSDDPGTASDDPDPHQPV